MTDSVLTIGELAKQGNVATSLLRFYEKEGLLEPAGRTAAGYRVYSADSVRHLRFIRKAQRYGFSLNDIKAMRGIAHQEGSGSDIRDIAEQRFLDIERRLTEMLVLRHELEIFLDDLTDIMDDTAGAQISGQYREIMEQVCGHEHGEGRTSSLRKLTRRMSCNLDKAEWEEQFSNLRGQHIHIWHEDDAYTVLFSDTSDKTLRALETIAAAEHGCEAHIEPEVAASEGGILFRAEGENAFLYAQLFMALENSQT